MASNIQIIKKIGDHERTVTIHTTGVKEDYQNQLIEIQPGKGDSGQGVDITGDESAARTKLKDRLKIKHAVEVSGLLKYDGTNSAEYQLQLLNTQMLFGKAGDEEFKTTLRGLKEVNTSGTVVAVDIIGSLTKISSDKVPEDLTATDEITEQVIGVTIQFIEGDSDKGFLRYRFHKNT